MATKRTTRQVSTDTLALHIHALYHGSGLVSASTGLTPWNTVHELTIVLHDYIQEGGPWVMMRQPVKGSDGGWLSEAAIKRHERLRGQLEPMIQLAHRHVMDRRRPSQRERWSNWGRHGVTWTYPEGSGGEHHATCVWCRGSILTMGKGNHRIGMNLLEKMERHSFVCAMCELAPVLKDPK
jgi:hypothetical protein